MSSSFSSDSESVDSNEYRGRIIKSDSGSYFALIKELGHGAFSSVWLACHLQENQFYALKILNKEDINSGNREIEAFDVLKHKTDNICHIKEHFMYDIDGDEEQLIIVFELMACTVFDLLRNGKYYHGLPYKVVQKIVKQVSHTLRIIHREGYIHTDIKPENLLVKGENPKIKELCDKFKSYNVKDKYNRQIGKDKHKQKWANLDIELMEEIIDDILDKILPDEDACSVVEETASVVEEEIDTSVEEEIDTSKDVDATDTDSTDSRMSVSFVSVGSMASDNETELVEIIDNKYVENIVVKIGDLGTVLKNKKSFSIQTRHYRAPEIILHYKCTDMLDIWSLGCLIYELLTGKTLFSPNKTLENNRNRCHIYDLVSKLGPIPDNMLDLSKRKHLYYRNDNILKGDVSLEYVPLSSFIKQTVKNLTDEQCIATTHFMYKTLEYDIEKRISLDEILKHPFVKA